MGERPLATSGSPTTNPAPLPVATWFDRLQPELQPLALRGAAVAAAAGITHPRTAFEHVRIWARFSFGAACIPGERERSDRLRAALLADREGATAWIAQQLPTRGQRAPRRTARRGQ